MDHTLNTLYIIWFVTATNCSNRLNILCPLDYIMLCLSGPRTFDIFLIMKMFFLCAYILLNSPLALTYILSVILFGHGGNAPFKLVFI